MVARRMSAMIELVPPRFSVDYLFATGLAGVFIAVMWAVGHIDPVGDAATRRVIYGATLAGGLALAWAVLTWVTATYSDSSARMSTVRARQGPAIRTVRFRLIVECMVLVFASGVGMAIDKDLTWRVYVFYPWVVAVVAVAIGLWRALWLQWRLFEIREVDDRVADQSPTPKAFEWRHSA
jgi:hypothetical protein